MSWASIASKPLTEEQKLQQKLAQEAKVALAHEKRVEALRDAIEACRGKVGGTSVNYPNDALHTVDGTWTGPEIALAQQMWCDLHYGFLAARGVQSLPPIVKQTGPHVGKVVGNCIINKGGGALGRHNIHIVQK